MYFARVKGTRLAVDLLSSRPFRSRIADPNRFRQPIQSDISWPAGKPGPEFTGNRART